jgi:hypothetical protein
MRIETDQLAEVLGLFSANWRSSVTSAPSAE